MRAVRLWSTCRGCKPVVPYKEEETSTNPPIYSPAFSSTPPQPSAKRVTRFAIHRTRRGPPRGEICETSEEIFQRLFPTTVVSSRFLVSPRFSSSPASPAAALLYDLSTQSSSFRRRASSRSFLNFIVLLCILSSRVELVPL